MSDVYIKMKSNWHEALTFRKFKIEFIFSICILIATMLLFSKFTEYVEKRPGTKFNDPILTVFEPIDLTKIIFTMIYGAIIVALVSLLNSPYKLTILFEAYSLMVITRMVTMFALPLSPPFDMILLQDPIVELFGTGRTLVNDLFFSGHTATIFLLYLAVDKKIKWVMLIMTFLVAAGVLLQKVHYTIDVLVAPYISFASYYVVSRIFYFRYSGLTK
jgi:hypothetical protein